MKTFAKLIPEYKLRKIKTNFNAVKIACSRDAADFIRKFYSDDGEIEIYESFFLLLLNRANHTTGFVKISQGGTTGTIADAKLIAKYAVDGLANSCVIAHNHPSGNISPSEQDTKLTQHVKQGLKLLDIDIIDHIILTADNYYSFADNGLI